MPIKKLKSGATITPPIPRASWHVIFFFIDFKASNFYDLRISIDKNKIKNSELKVRLQI